MLISAQKALIETITDSILIDCDGIISDFRELYVRVCNKVNGTDFCGADAGPGNAFSKNLRLTKRQQREVWEHLNVPGWVGNMHVLPGALEGVKELARLGNVVFLTAVTPSRCWMPERVEWLRKHFGFVCATDGNSIESHIVFAADAQKPYIPGRIYIDDKHPVVSAWVDVWGPFGARGYYHPQPYEPFEWGSVIETLEKEFYQ